MAPSAWAGRRGRKEEEEEKPAARVAKAGRNLEGEKEEDCFFFSSACMETGLVLCGCCLGWVGWVWVWVGGWLNVPFDGSSRG